MPAVFIALMIGISLKKPILLVRTLAWLWVPLALVLGHVLARRVKAIAIAFAVAAICLAGAGVTIHLQNLDHLREDWRGFLARLPGLGPPALVVLAPHTSPAALALYAPEAAAPVRLEGGFPPIAETTLVPGLFGTRTIDPSEMKQAIEAGRPVWLIVRRPDVGWMAKAIADLPPPKLTVEEPETHNPAIRALRW